ncbi:MAG: GNAT family N-acetyltransferase [Vulcanimicrobiota bacterium]
MNPAVFFANPTHAAELARIHHRALPDDFLPRLGRDFLEQVYWPAALGSLENGLTLIMEGPVAFATVAWDSPGFTRQIVRKNVWKLAYYALRSCLRNPLNLWRCVEVAYASLLARPHPVAAEIVLIAVEAEHRGQGMGRLLVQAASEIVRRQGQRRLRTKTLARNLNVIGLYESEGWTIDERFRLIGKDYVTLVSPEL